jgi:hypothetical protein
MPKTISHNEFIPKDRKITATTWETRTPIRWTYAEVDAAYLSDVKRGLFDKVKASDQVDNVYMYYILINSWLLLCRDCHAEGYADYLESCIRKQGLLCTIAESDKRSDLVIQGLDPELAFPTFRGAWSDDEITRISSEITGERCDDPKAAKLQVVLQLLRYPKRFSPSGLKGAREAVWKKFIGIQGRWKNIVKRDISVRSLRSWGDYHDIPDRTVDTHKGNEGTFQYIVHENINHRYIMDFVKEVVHEMIGEYKYGGLEEMIQTGDIKLSPGATQDTCSCTFCKAFTVEQYTNYYGLSSYKGRPVKVGGGCIHPIMVNKNYKTYRMIAPEESLTQAVCYHEQRKLYEAFKKSRYGKLIDLDKEWHNGIKGEGQDRSRRAALLGSLDNSLDTYDWSSASDTIMKHLSYYVATREARRMLDLFASQYVDEDGHKHTLYTTGTSGNSITFLWEGIIILAIVIVALRMAGASEEVIMQIIVYGDDTIVPHGYALIVRDVAHLLGLEMNPDKTCFSESYYREACGGEYFHGHDLSTLYFPRNLNVSDTARASMYNETPNRTTSIIALANRFAKFEDSQVLGNTMHQFILAVIRFWFPDLRLGGDVIGPKSTSTMRGVTTSSSYGLKSVKDRSVFTDGIDIPHHATHADVGSTVHMHIATSVTIAERHWVKIPNAKSSVRQTPGWSENGTYIRTYAKSDWRTSSEIWFEDYSTTIELWDTPDDIKGRLLEQWRQACSKAKRNVTYNVLNRRLNDDILLSTPTSRVKWNKSMNECSNYSIFNDGVTAEGYERRILGYDKPHVTFETERPYLCKDATATSTAVESWSVPVTRAKSQTIARRPKQHCLCNKLTERERREWWEMYTYQRYLAEGPEYEDELMRNLHVSRRRMTYDQAYGSKKVNLVNIYEPYNE